MRSVTLQGGILKRQTYKKLKHLLIEQEAAAQTNQPQEQMVWVSQSGSKYHSNSSCSNMKNPTQITISEAQNQGLEPCKNVIKFITAPAII